MDPTVIAALIAAGIGVGGWLVSALQRRRAARTELTVAQVAAEVDKTKIVVAEWQRLYKILDSRVRELSEELADCERSKVLLQSQVFRLEARVDRLGGIHGPQAG